MKPWILVFAIPLFYGLLTSINLLPHDTPVMMLVLLNSVVWGLHYLLRDQLAAETQPERVPVKIPAPPPAARRPADRRHQEA